MNVKQFVFLLLISSLFPFSIVNAQFINRIDSEPSKDDHLLEKIGSEQTATSLGISENWMEFELKDVIESEGDFFLTLISGETMNGNNYKRRFIEGGGYVFQLDPSLNIKRLLKLPIFMNGHRIRHISLCESMSNLSYYFIGLNKRGDSLSVYHREIDDSLKFIGEAQRLLTVEVDTKLKNVCCQLAQSPNKKLLAVQVSILEIGGVTQKVVTEVFDNDFVVKGVFSNVFLEKEWTGTVKPYVNNSGNVFVLSSLQTVNEVYERLLVGTKSKIGRSKREVKKVYLHYFNTIRCMQDRFCINENEYLAAWHATQDQSGNIILAYSYTDEEIGKYKIKSYLYDGQTAIPRIFPEFTLSSLELGKGYPYCKNVFTGLSCVDSNILYVFEDFSFYTITSYFYTTAPSSRSRYSQYESHSTTDVHYTGGQLIIANIKTGKHNSQSLSYFRVVSPVIEKLSTLDFAVGTNNLYIQLTGSGEYFYYSRSDAPGSEVINSVYYNIKTKGLVTGTNSKIRESLSSNLRFYCATKWSKLRFAYVKYL